MSAPRTRIVRIATIIAVLVLIVGCDQATKSAARSCLSSIQPLTYLGGVLKLTLHQNPGAFLSLGSNWPEVFRVLVFSILCSLAVAFGLGYVVLKRDLSTRAVIAASLMLGGAIGNLIDRFLFHGLVTDFLLLSVGALHTGVFNVADIAVVAGVGIWWYESKHRMPPSLNRSDHAGPLGLLP